MSTPAEDQDFSTDPGKSTKGVTSTDTPGGNQIFRSIPSESPEGVHTVDALNPNEKENTHE